MIAAKDAEGIVRAALPGLARMANLTLEETIESIAVLESPDPHSSSTEHDGRRVLKVEGGWQVINHQKYRDKITELKAYNARKQAEYRKRRAQALAAQYPPSMVKTKAEVAAEAEEIQDFKSGFPD
jgi:hypothetical protein